MNYAWIFLTFVAFTGHEAWARPPKHRYCNAFQSIRAISLERIEEIYQFTQLDPDRQLRFFDRLDDGGLRSWVTDLMQLRDQTKYGNKKPLLDEDKLALLTQLKFMLPGRHKSMDAISMRIEKVRKVRAVMSNWLSDPASPLRASAHRVGVMKDLLRGMIWRQELTLMAEEILLLLDLNMRSVEKRVSQYEMFSHLGEALWSRQDLFFGWNASFSDIVQMYKYMEFKPGDRIVDIGSGHGYAGFAAGLFLPQVKFMGFEIVLERLLEAQRVAALSHFANVNFELQDVSLPDFELPDAQFYYIYDSLNESTMRVTLDRLARQAERGAEFVVAIRQGSGLDFRIAKGDSRFELFGQINGHQPTYLFRVHRLTGAP